MNLSFSEKKKILRAKLDSLTRALWTLQANNAHYLGFIKKYVSQENLWVITRLMNILEVSIPLTTNKGIDYFAPEIGKFQGFTSREKFLQKHNVQPYLLRKKLGAL